MLDKRSFYIDGQWVEPDSEEIYDVVNPATEEKIARITLGSRTDLDQAVAAARKAFAGYAAASVAQRLNLLEQFRRIYVRRYDEMADLITQELGAPRTLSREQQAETGLGHLDAFIAALKTFRFKETLADGDELLREPVGVCGLITPWNWPVNQIALKVMPALAAGCTCVLKPAELTPLSAMLYAEMIHEAGFPPGTFNLVNGDGATVGSSMASHPNIEMISFTGSTRAGIAVSKAAADNIKRVTLELGGKSPNIVFADADFQTAVQQGVGDCMNNTGQSCDAPTRMLVEKKVFSQVEAMVKAAVENLTVGDPHAEGPHMGPLVSETHFRRVQALINTALDEGSRLLTGGPGRPDGFEKGFYCRPTVFTHVSNSMTIAREEVFGPVLALIPFDTQEQAIAIANDTPYGLAAYVHSSDPERCRSVARKLRAGMVHINGGGIKYGAPFGGYKMSGNGREGGILGLEEFTEVKVLHY